MYERHWAIIAALLVAIVIAAAIGWVAGRSTAPDASANPQNGSAHDGAMRDVDGVPIGVEHSRAGALAAADNYVATSSQTVAQDPAAFRQLVRTVWAPAAQRKGLAEGIAYRNAVPDAIDNYAAGGRGLSVIAARKLESYTGRKANVVSWGGGFVWGPSKKPAQRWFLVRTKLVWAGDRWRVESLDELKKAAPVPYEIAAADPAADDAETFETQLDGMTAPIYGLVSD